MLSSKWTALTPPTLFFSMRHHSIFKLSPQCKNFRALPGKWPRLVFPNLHTLVFFYSMKHFCMLSLRFKYALCIKCAVCWICCHLQWVLHVNLAWQASEPAIERKCWFSHAQNRLLDLPVFSIISISPILVVVRVWCVAQHQFKPLTVSIGRNIFREIRAIQLNFHLHLCVWLGFRKYTIQYTQSKSIGWRNTACISCSQRPLTQNRVERVNLRCRDLQRQCRC